MAHPPPLELMQLPRPEMLKLKSAMVLLPQNPAPMLLQPLQHLAAVVVAVLEAVEQLPQLPRPEITTLWRYLLHHHGTAADPGAREIAAIVSLVPPAQILCISRLGRPIRIACERLHQRTVVMVP